MLNVRKVVVGISGGVDSAVAALLLKQKGYDVHGVFMQNWDIADERGYCSADEDYKDACLVCEKLKIKLTHVNFVKHYWNEVFCNLVKEYESGYTPNPDILCNRNVKFNHFYKFVREELGADALATGHYARTSFGAFLEHYNPKVGVRLLSARDEFKDQTFFLCQVKQEALQRTMFPVGALLKSEVKKIAAENGLEKISRKKESMGICFIGNRKFRDFITEYIADKPGDMIDVDSLENYGQHRGLHQWTLGQRARIGTLSVPSFIARKDVENNALYIVRDTNHPLLYTNIIFTEEPFWIHSKPPDLEQGVLECDFKFQHTKFPVSCLVVQTSKGLVIKVNKYKRAITPGQYAVLWKDGECLGSARIRNSGLSHFSLFYLKNHNMKEDSGVLNQYNCKDVLDDDDFTDNRDMKKIALNT